MLPAHSCMQVISICWWKWREERNRTTEMIPPSLIASCAEKSENISHGTQDVLLEVNESGSMMNLEYLLTCTVSFGSKISTSWASERSFHAKTSAYVKPQNIQSPKFGIQTGLWQIKEMIYIVSSYVIWSFSNLLVRGIRGMMPPNFVTLSQPFYSKLVTAPSEFVNMQNILFVTICFELRRKRFPRDWYP